MYLVKCWLKMNDFLDHLFVKKHLAIFKVSVFIYSVLANRNRFQAAFIIASCNLCGLKAELNKLTRFNKLNFVASCIMKSELVFHWLFLPFHFLFLLFIFRVIDHCNVTVCWVSCQLSNNFIFVWTKIYGTC